MVVLLLLAALLPEPVSSSLYGSRFLAGGLGGSITHQCFYSPTPANKHDRKYWCKIAPNGVCYTIVSSGSYTSSGYEGRVALRDTPQNGTFTVTVTGLRSSDAGTYRCGIGGTNEGLYVSLNLTVLADAPPSRPTQLIHGELHGSVTVLCPSGDTHSDKERFWCKMGRSICTLIASSDGYVGWRYQGRVLISPQDSSGAFRVLMNDLKKEDSGLYLCGTRGQGQASPQEVVLQVTTASTTPRRPKFLSGTVGGSVTFQCHHDPEGTYEKQYLCRWRAGSCSVLLDQEGFVPEPYRGRVRAGSDPASLTVLLQKLRQEDAGWYWCGARSGDTEITAPLKLHVHRAPGTTAPVRATSPNPAAHSTATHRSVTRGMGTATKGTATMGTATMGTATKSTRMGIVNPGTATKGTGTMGTRMDTATMGTATMGTTTMTATATPGSSVASPGEALQESSSGGSQLLPVVLPALLLLISITITALTLAKIKLQKKTGGEGGNVQREDRMEQNLSPGEVQEPTTGSGKCRKISAILGNIRMTNFYLPCREKVLFEVTDEDLSQNLL